VKEESHGLANAYNLMVISLANFVASFLLRISDVNTKFVYYFTGVLTCLLTIMIVFGLRDAVKVKNDEQQGQTKLMVVMKESWHLIRYQPIILLSVFGDTCARMIAILCSTYTTLVVTDAYKHQGKSEEDAKQHLSTIFMTANITSFFFALMYGYCEKYMSVINCILLSNIVIFVGAIFFISSIDTANLSFSISYVIVGSLNTGNFVLTQTMLMRELKENSRASILSF